MMISSNFEDIVTTILSELDLSYELNKGDGTNYIYFPIDYGDGGRAVGVIFFNDKVPILSLRAVIGLPIEEDNIIAAEFKAMINRINRDIAFYRTYLNPDLDLEIAADFEFIEGTKNIKDIIRFYMIVLISLPGQVDEELKDMLKFIMDVDD